MLWVADAVRDINEIKGLQLIKSLYFISVQITSWVILFFEL